MRLSDLDILDYTIELDRLPRRSGFRMLPERTGETAITFHYAGVQNTNRSRTAELDRLRGEAIHHLNRNWSTSGRVYGDGLMYDFAVLSDGSIVRTRARRQQLWHCGNALGNATSWSTHVMLGPGQELTDAQRSSLFMLWDALRAEFGIARARVVGHNEWPRNTGEPQPSTVYRVLTSQSECPGAVLHRELVRYRSLTDDCSLAPTRSPAVYTAESSLLAPTNVDAATVVRYLTSRPTGSYTRYDIAHEIVPAYLTYCERAGLDAALVIAQMVHETGNLTSFWAQRPRRNPAGIGVNGQSRRELPGSEPNWAFNPATGLWHAGVSFPTWKNHAIPAHVGRLLAYVLPAGAETAVQKELIDYATTVRIVPPQLRGSVTTIRQLGAVHNRTGLGWATPGHEYGERIAQIANQIVSA